MVQKDARARIQSGGTQISRRTVARGVAWSVPVVAVASAAPAFAASPGCKPVVTFSTGSCKCPGRSTKTQNFVYFLNICVTDAAGCTTTPAGKTFTVVKVESNLELMSPAQPNCGFLSLPASGTVNGACTGVIRLESKNSSSNLSVTLMIDGVTLDPIDAQALPQCTSVLETDRCTACETP